jgi:hypothetical protein
MGESSLHVAMYPWFAIGHITPFLYLSNKLAEKGHTISFFIPTNTGNTQAKLQHLNLYPDRISFVPITVPHVDGLPPDAETTLDLPSSLYSHLMTAMDQTESHIELLLRELKPDIVLFDLACWVPKLTRKLGIKSIYYCVITTAPVGYTLVPARQRSGYHSETDFMQPPSGFPVSSIALHVHETRLFAAMLRDKFGSDVLFSDRLFASSDEADALGYWACREIEGPCIDYLASQFEKPVLVSGPILVEPPASTLEEKWVEWLGSFKAGSVIYCALGSEIKLTKDQFQELVLGFELCGSPFLAALKPPVGAESVEAALPEGFEERIKGKGIVDGGWVPQRLILGHPSIGCFVTHCGSGSLLEALRSRCQLVTLPQIPDQIINARMMANYLKVGVEVEKGEEDGFFTKGSVCKAVRSVMEVDSEVGRLVKANHAKLRDLLLSEDLQSSYIDSFCQKLTDLVA